MKLDKLFCCFLAASVTALGCGSSATPSTDSSHTISGTISGLTGSGLVLQLNGANDLAIDANASTFSFTQAVASYGAYSVTVLANPSNPTETCTVSNGTGAVATSDITGVSIVCSTSCYNVTGSISGLTGSGLVLQFNDQIDLDVDSGATSFTFPFQVADGASYKVTVKTQPTEPFQTCEISNGNGTISSQDSAVVVTCTDDPSVQFGGTISSLASAATLDLTLNGTTETFTSSNASSFAFTFATEVVVGDTYTVEVAANASNNQSCIVRSGGSGTVEKAVSNIDVLCSPPDILYSSSEPSKTGTVTTVITTPYTSGSADSFSTTAMSGSHTFSVGSTEYTVYTNGVVVMSANCNYSYYKVITSTIPVEFSITATNAAGQTTVSQSVLLPMCINAT